MNKENNEQIYGRNDMVMLDQHNKIYGSLGIADNYVLKTEEGNDLILKNPRRGVFDDVLTEFNIYGYSTQKTTTGANLLVAPIEQSPYDTYVPGHKITKSGVTFEVLEDYSVKVTGKNDGSVTYAQVDFFYPAGNRPLFSAGDYYGAEIHGSYQFDRGQNVNVGHMFTLEEDAYLNGFYIAITVSDGEMDEIYYPMINAGTVQKPYEPYTGGKPSPNPDYPKEIVSAGDKGNIDVSITDGKNSVQTLALSTPNGLPGIPVSSGGNYTDENGRQWICDEIDFARGKYIQRIKKAEFDGSDDEDWTSGLNIIYIIIRDAKSNTLAKCSHFKNYQYISGYHDGFCNNVNKAFCFKQEGFEPTDNLNVATWREFLQQEPISIIYILNEPIEIDLTAEQITQYKAIHTNTPTTVISNDEQIYMKVTYKATESV